METLSTLLNGLWRGAEQAARHRARRGLWGLAALLFAALGAGFVGFALYTALRHAAGTVPAALIMAIGLFAVAAVLMLTARLRTPLPMEPAIPAALAQTPRYDPTTTAAFTMAFVIGRTLADRLKR